jgi:DNA-binding CsgD family transcriptional regulator
MKTNHIKEVYREIFKSYYKPSLEEHIKKIIELDTYLPYSSTFFCVTNTQDLSFEYISKNMEACLGINPINMQQQGMRYFWSLIHPDDIEIWLKALNELMIFTLSDIPVNQRKRMSYTWNYRIKNAAGNYVTVIQNTTPLEFDTEMKPIIGLAHYTVMHPDIHFPITATAKLLNESNTYETKYFNNFSEKLLTDGITNRERDIVRLLALNFSSKAIAESLNISPNTVDTHRRNILKKLQITSTGELIGMLKSHEMFL